MTTAGGANATEGRGGGGGGGEAKGARLRERVLREAVRTISALSSYSGLGRHLTGEAGSGAGVAAGSGGGAAELKRNEASPSSDSDPRIRLSMIYYIMKLS